MIDMERWWPWRRLCAAAGLAVLAARAVAAEPEVRVGLEAQTDLAVTIYNQDVAMVSERRRVQVAEGANELLIEGVSRAMEPETLLLRGPGLQVLEQRFLFDLLTPRRLLEASLGQEVRVVKTHPTTGEETVLEARLLSVAEGPVLQIGDRIETAPVGRIVFDRVPGHLRERPALAVRLEGRTARERLLEISYLTGGLSWQADYVAELTPAGDRLDLLGSVTLTNTSGVAYRDARLRLVAGQVNRVSAPPLPRPQAMMRMAESAAAPPGLAAQPVGEQHLYQLDRNVSIADRETKQVTLLAATAVPVVKEYRFEELVSADRADEIGPVKAAVHLVFENDEAGGLGRPLPLGVVRVYQPLGGDGAQVFVGEDRLAHTPEGEEVRLTVGRAFDVSGRARRTAFERLSNKSYETAQAIAIKNAKAEPVQAKVIGRFPPGTRILEESAGHERETANRVVWTLTVPAKGEAELRYRVRVTRP